jgi:hypothetical protein
MVFSKKRNLRAKTAQDIGYSQDSKLFINDISRAIFNKVKEFKRQHEFKFIWTRQGKILLKKNESQSETHVFTSLKEFEAFNEKFGV